MYQRNWILCKLRMNYETQCTVVDPSEFIKSLRYVLKRPSLPSVSSLGGICKRGFSWKWHGQILCRKIGILTETKDHWVPCAWSRCASLPLACSHSLCRKVNTAPGPCREEQAYPPRSRASVFDFHCLGSSHLQKRAWLSKGNSLVYTSVPTNCLRPQMKIGRWAFVLKRLFSNLVETS